jgi:hypothetical protein
MADWYGTARTNYVLIKDMEGLKKALEPFDVSIKEHPKHKGFVRLDPSSSQDGDFPSTVFDDDDEEIEFSFPEHVVPYLAEGQVLIATAAGADGLRYITGWATAFAWNGQTKSISISDITKVAARAFRMDPSQIARPAYEEVPDAFEEQLSKLAATAGSSGPQPEGGEQDKAQDGDDEASEDDAGRRPRQTGG